MAATTYWERLGDRAERTGVLETIENPITIVAMAAAWTIGAAINSAFIAAIFLWFGEFEAAWVSTLMMVIYLAGWFIFAATGSVRPIFAVLVGVSLLGVSVMHVALGGYANSGGLLFWFVGISLVFVMLLPRAATVAAVVLITTVAVVFGFLEQDLQAGRPAPDPTLPSIMFPYTLIALILLLVPIIGLLVNRLTHERGRAEGLLLNVLPAEVAAELKETGSTTAQRFDAISVLFADIVGFTPMSAEMAPEEMVDRLNDVFTYFDDLAERYGVEKIRTIGDNYMVAAGVPVPRPDHAQALAAMALDMLEYSEAGPLSFRIGINSGPAVAGVIGTRKFQYDVWGDTVNTASRMESHGEAGRIQITDATHQLIKDNFTTTPRGPIDVKGKGTMHTWWLDAEPATATAGG